MDHTYVFTGAWQLPAPVEVVYSCLERLDLYPEWWPQVREARRIDDDTCAVVVRSSLPYALKVTAHRHETDPATGKLHARLSGDLVGFTGWTLTPYAGGTRAAFHERVEATKPLLRTLGFLRPVLRANHAWMMRAGERGLSSRLASRT
ncbi:MAG: SRPBCC family protein [Sporichthyaceae bacterium]